LKGAKNIVAMAAKTIGRKAGVEVSRYRPFDARVARRLVADGVPLVVDVGANRGQYASRLRQLGYQGRIVSYEPLAAAFEELVAASSEDDAWTCHPIALGDRHEEAEIHVATNSASSSLLEMAAAHREAAPGVAVSGSESVRVAPLDAVLDAPETCLLKLDVQGYEDRVLDGAAMTLERAALVECELSLAGLYHGQASARILIDRLNELGFDLVDLDPFFYDPTDGRVLSLDALFERRGA
jgi:FkbM family methyltransferase